MLPLRSYMSIAVDLRQERTGPAKYIQKRNIGLGAGLSLFGLLRIRLRSVLATGTTVGRTREWWHRADPKCRDSCLNNSSIADQGFYHFLPLWAFLAVGNVLARWLRHALIGSGLQVEGFAFFPCLFGET